jgi:hypothetical protein
MNHHLRQITSGFLLVAFLFAIAPKEFLHHLAGHEDTRDCTTDGVTAISSEHIHCQILQLQVNPFTESDAVIMTVQPFFPEVNTMLLPASHDFVAAPTILLRGPPSRG